MQTASGLAIRKRIRLREFVYGGHFAYYITICAFQKRLLFGSCDGVQVTLTELGRLVQNSWLETQALRPEAVLDELIVMPNHMHAIVRLTSEEPGHDPASVSPMQKPLFRVVGGFKSHVTSVWRAMKNDETLQVWQVRFNDRVIRTEHELLHEREYIRANPERWRR